jgi:hypothetical protein
MRTRRVIKISLLVSVGLLLAIGLGVYLQASRLPEDYRPARLGREQRIHASKQFYRKLMDFNNSAQRVRPFTLTLQQDRVNEYLTSLDEIATARAGVKAGTVHKAMDRLGLSDPAVAFADNEMTLMVRSRKAGKVLSADLEMDYTDDGKLIVRLTGARVGRLPLPPALVDSQVNRIKAALTRRLRAARNGSSKTPSAMGPSAADVGKALAVLLAAIDAQPVSTRLTWDGKPFVLDRIRLEDGRVHLDFRPVG